MHNISKTVFGKKNLAGMWQVLDAKFYTVPH